MRERLIELIDRYTEGCLENICQPYGTDGLADYLLENGVVMLPVKVGDTVFRISTRFYTKIKYIEKTKISRIALDNDETWLFCECNPTSKTVFGKTVFLTREEAEQALKEREK